MTPAAYAPAGTLLEVDDLTVVVTIHVLELDVRVGIVRENR